MIKIILNLGLILLISGCSLLNFWSDEDENLEEPKQLVDIKTSIEINRLWSRNFNSDNELGNYRLGFSGNDILITSEEGILFRINAFSGNIVQKDVLNHLVSVSNAVGFGKIVFADSKGFVHAYSLEDLSFLWSSNVGSEILALPVIDAKGVIVHTSGGELLALNPNTGERVWSYRSQLPSLTVRGNSIPLISENFVYATFDNGRIGVFDIDSGFSVWDGPISYKEGTSELENLVDADSSPVIDGGLVFATNFQGNLAAFDLTQRRAVWGTKASSFHSPLILKGLILVVNDDGMISSYSAQTLSESWTNDEYLRRNLSNAVEFNGDIIVGDLEGYVHVINTLNGKTIGRKKISNKPIKFLSTRGNQLFVLDSELRVIALD